MEAPNPPSSRDLKPDVALRTVLSDLRALHDSPLARPFQDAVDELSHLLECARADLLVRLADDDGPRSGDLRVLRRLDLAFRRVAEILAEARLDSAQRRILERAADLLRTVQGCTRAHLLSGRA